MHQAHQPTYLGMCRAPRAHLWARRLPHHCDELRPRWSCPIHAIIPHASSSHMRTYTHDNVMVVCVLLPIDRHCKHFTCLQWLYTNRGSGGCGKPGVCPELRRPAIDGQPQGRYLVCVLPGRYIRPGQGEVHSMATHALNRCVYHSMHAHMFMCT